LIRADQENYDAVSMHGIRQSSLGGGYARLGGVPSLATNLQRMTFPELRAMIDSRLEAEPRLDGSVRELRGDDCVWTRNDEGVAIRAQGSTGILLEYLSRGRVVHQRVYAASPLSIERVVNTCAEHLTGYIVHRT
jgi:hypothetical protein